MPRLYLTPTELAELPLGIGIGPQLAQLGAGVVDKMLMRASERVDGYCKKRLGAPGVTTLSQAVSAGTTILPVTSTLGFDNLDEQALIIGSGGTQETVPLVSGGVNVSTPLSPYPGTLTLASPLVNNHLISESIQGVYYEVTEAGSSSSSDPYTEAMETQAAQLALAHLPSSHGALTRVVFTKNYPIMQIYNIEHAFSFVNQFNSVDLTIESIVPSEGWFRFNVATVILREGLMRTTYTGGYVSVPDDIKTAVGYYFAEQMMQATNPYAWQSLTQGKRSVHWGNLNNGKNPLVLQAEDILKRYRRMV